MGIETGDDAGVFSLGNGRALVQTVDIFTPVVDSPHLWGRISAANALSDIYAMGATPMTALQYLAWPRDDLSLELASEVIAGGMDVMAEAGCTVVGGHTIDGPEPHYGFAVTGDVSEDGLVTNAGGQPGAVLVLTKPLGMGIISTAIKHGKCPEALEMTASELMEQLNDRAGAGLVLHGAYAATDVTGFGLLGHLDVLCSASGVGAEIKLDQVPVLSGVTDLLADGMWPGGSQRNLESLVGDVTTSLDIEMVKPLFDAQTSGGLLVALPEDRVQGYIDSLPGPNGSVIGHLTSGKGLSVV